MFAMHFPLRKKDDIDQGGPDEDQRLAFDKQDFAKRR
jgi:hypothetical protein